MKQIGWVVVLVLVSTAAWAQNGHASPRALEASMNHFLQNAAVYGLSNPAAELKARKGFKDEFGTEHVRFDQFHKGVKVFEGEAIGHVNSWGEVSVTDALIRDVRVDVVPSFSRQAAIATAVRATLVRGGYQVPLAELVVLPHGQRSPVDVLTWHIRVFVDDDVQQAVQYDYFVDAHTGAVVWSFDSLETTGAVGTGRTMYVGNVSVNTDFTSNTYFLRDLTRGSGNYTCDMGNRQSPKCSIFTRSNNIFGNNQRDLSDRATAGADAHYGLQATWDYYLAMFGRNGIDGAGRKSFSRVHYGRNYENAFWSNSCFCMTYGDGASTFLPLVSLDVAAHEMSHGVMSSEANLTYSGESGGLNEGNSDIFGTLVEFAVNSAQDVGDYWIGERIYRSNWSTGSYVQSRALRYQDDPHRDGVSPACWSSSIGSLDVHYSSGPINHWFWLVSNPATNTSKCNSQQVTGIGRDAAARIWYRAISVYMTASTNYHGARSATLNAAADLFGSSSSQYAAVAAAFSAINVN